MHIYFSGIGAGTGPLALIASQAGFEISGSDKQPNSYVDYLKQHANASVHIGQTTEAIETLHRLHPIDWVVISSAVEKENTNHPEILFAKSEGIRISKRDEFLSELLKKTNQKMIAIAGTHGKTTTTAMTIWLAQELNIPISYSVGAKLSFADMGHFDANAEYFIYEADEYDRNFLSYQPFISIISGIAYDHPDIYPTQNEYNKAFLQFFEQSENVFLWQDDANKLEVMPSQKIQIANKIDYKDIANKLIGVVNRENAALVVQAIHSIDNSRDIMQLSEIMDRFPGVSRRFERISSNIYTDYAHTPEKIRGALQIARERAEGKLIVVYEGLHNTRQHFIKNELTDLFTNCDKLYIVPSYLARENKSLELLTPEMLCEITKNPDDREPAELNNELAEKIREHSNAGDLVLCLTAGGGGSLDEWLRAEFHS